MLLFFFLSFLPSYFPFPAHFAISLLSIIIKITNLVADVGLSKILRDRFLSTMQAVGTFAWAAPEVLLGKPTSESADIYSFGVLLWELSIGEAPPGRALRDIEVPGEAPQEVADLVARCMDEDPERRPTALELVHFFKDLDLNNAPSSGSGVSGGGQGSSSKDGGARKSVSSGAGEEGSREEAAKAAVAEASVAATETEGDRGKPTLPRRLSKKISKVLSLKSSSDRETGSQPAEARAPAPSPSPPPQARPQLPNPFGGGAPALAATAAPAAASAPVVLPATAARAAAPRAAAPPFVSPFGGSSGGPPASTFGDRAAK